MQQIDVTPRVWERLLEVRQGRASLTGSDWTLGEQLALELYGNVADRSSKSRVLGQIGQSLDGRISTDSGESRDVSGPDGLVHLHRLRALVDGVVIGVKTALHDSPKLTVRLCDGPNPARIVIDPRGRLPNDSAVLAENGARRIVIQAVDTSRPQGVEVIKLEAKDSHFHPQQITEALTQAGLQHLLIEGGSFTLAKFIDHQFLDRLHIAVAPIIIGSGQAGLTLSQQSSMLKDSIRPQSRAFALGSEVLFDCGFLRS